MITLKLKYRLKDEQDISFIRDYQRQYSSCLHFLYNRISDNPSITEKELRLLYNNINNCSLINKWLFQCAIGEAKQIYKSHGTNMPDMVLASIEIGRRGYEYSSQYIDKTKNKKRNIVFPDISDFYDFYTKSLEEFSIEEKSNNLLALYSYIKNAKMTYRVPISGKLVGFRLRSLNRFVYKINKLI